MKKYLMILLITILYSCSNNRFSGKKFKLIPINPMLQLELKVTHYHVVQNYISDNEMQIITYDDNDKEVGTEKKNYSIIGSFLNIEDEKYEIRSSIDTIELYRDGEILFKLVQQH